MTSRRTFVFEDMAFDMRSLTASLRYSYDSQHTFEEKIIFGGHAENVNEHALQAALKLCFLLAGTSYYKTFAAGNVDTGALSLDAWQVDFLNKVYSHGLSQFVYENGLTADVLPVFKAGGNTDSSNAYEGSGILAMQSGGKDSLLTAALLESSHTSYTPWYMLYGEHYPAVIDSLSQRPRTVQRQLDLEALRTAQDDGGYSGHVPVTFIVMAFALIDMILHGEKTLLVSIGNEGEEPHAYVGDLPVNHQWANTWQAEQLFAAYVHRYISPDIQVGSPLRHWSELRIAELFAERAWPRFGHSFSSCNLANYKQGSDNRQLKWDGTCPKCANTFLLFAPFIEPRELADVIGGNLLQKTELTETFKGLLGIDGVTKPLECVGETGELRLAYHMAREKWGARMYTLPFEVPPSDFDYREEDNSQDWARDYLKV